MALSVVIHEIGHSIFYMFYGYKAIPSFDFQYGGGLTSAVSNRSYVFAFVVFAIFMALAFLFRKYNRNLSIILMIAISLVFTLTFTRYHHVIIAFMGHGFEIIIGCFFLYRCIFNFSFNETYERFLNGFFGFFLNLQLIKYFYQVIYDENSRFHYLNQKGQVASGDFNVIAFDLMISLNSVCFFAIICACLAVLVPVVHYLLVQILKEE